jgi:HicB family
MTMENRNDQKKLVVKKFPLRLMPSVRKVAEDVSQKEGVSLNQFINLAVAEKVAHLQHEEWLARRPKASPASIAKALEILDRPTPYAPEAEDKLPKNYPSTRSAARK